VDDFDAAYQRMAAAGVEFVTSPRTEPYGRVVVFRDIAGNRWDLLGPPRLPGRGVRTSRGGAARPGQVSPVLIS
jgi:hypothetical protein